MPTRNLFSSQLENKFVHYQAKLLTLSAKFSKIVTLLCHTF